VIEIIFVCGFRNLHTFTWNGACDASRSLSLDPPRPNSVEVWPFLVGVVSYLTSTLSVSTDGGLIKEENDELMKLTPWYLAAIAPIAVASFSGMLLGQFAVLAVTLGIFLGTLSLGRQSSAAEAAQQVAQVDEP
jgi:hypothetical protein